MKTKLMVLALMAGGSMFAASRFSVGVNLGAVAPACAPSAYNSYVAPGYVAPVYVAPSYNYGYGYRDFDHRDGRAVDRGHERDNRGRERDSRSYSNSFRRH